MMRGKPSRQHGTALVVALSLLIILMGLAMVIDAGVRRTDHTVRNYELRAQARILSNSVMNWAVEKIAQSDMENSTQTWTAPFESPLPGFVISEVNIARSETPDQWTIRTQVQWTGGGRSVTIVRTTVVQKSSDSSWIICSGEQ